MEFDALDAARRLAASGLPWCWLDGTGAAPGERRVSLLGIGSEVRRAHHGGEREFLESLRPAGAPGRSLCAGGSAAGVAAAEAPASGVTDPGFSAGWVVALGYEFGVALMGIDPHPDDADPAFALRLDAVAQFDHDRGTLAFSGDPLAVRELETLFRSGADVAPRTAREAPEYSASAGSSESAGSPAAWRSTGAEYERLVAECGEHIAQGDAYVLCLTDTADAVLDTADAVLETADALSIYERLRASGAACRGGVISVPGRALVSASPERFLSVRGGEVRTRPIKGTRRRGATAAEDAAAREDLARDPKERAENLMIVDLMRNDLSRVCETGSVRVERFLEVEAHPLVHQLVSTVAGTLRAGFDVFDAILACFPAGSMTGAPKRSAVEILGTLEAGPRGLYSGCFGWIDDAGDAELAMTIRGVEFRAQLDSSVRASVGAGGGITSDSVPAREQEEKLLKADAVLAALAAPRGLAGGIN